MAVGCWRGDVVSVGAAVAVGFRRGAAVSVGAAVAVGCRSGAAVSVGVAAGCSAGAADPHPAMTIIMLDARATVVSRTTSFLISLHLYGPNKHT